MKPKTIRFSLLGFYLLAFFFFLPFISTQQAWADATTQTPSTQDSPPPDIDSPPQAPPTWKCYGQPGPKTMYTFGANTKDFNAVCTEDAEPTDWAVVNWDCVNTLTGEHESRTATAPCSSISATLCSDGITAEGEEECDDGNLTDFDGCNSQCVWEFCGDGIENKDFVSLVIDG